MKDIRTPTNSDGSGCGEHDYGTLSDGSGCGEQDYGTLSDGGVTGP